MDKLSQDAAAANAAGMSYGKWKARQPEKPPVKRFPLDDQGNTKICEFCGKTYLSKKRNQKYCCSECCDKARDQQQYQRKRLQRAEQ